MKLFEHLKRRKRKQIEFYTRSCAADIIELFEDVLDQYDITVPSPEDDEKDPGNEARLYGSVYWDLLDEVEYLVIAAMTTAANANKKFEIVPYIFK